jgi:CRISPR-associated endonuclease/helicase Cas3
LASSDPMERLVRWPGKSPVTPGGPMHPAVYHMLDVAAVAEELVRPLNLPPARRDLVCLLVALHDVGKIRAEFQAMLLGGAPQWRRHWEVSEVWLRQNEALLLGRLGGEPRALRPLVAAVAGHHGRPPGASEGGLGGANDFDLMARRAGADAAEDAAAVIAAFLDLWPGAQLDLSPREAKALSWWLAGLTTIADWVGSNVEWFPPRPPDMALIDYLTLARDLALRATREAGLAHAEIKSASLYDFALRPMQEAARRLPLREGPMLAVLEDETGSGKTEAALLLAQRMLLAGKGRGLYLALPTMATADAMFVRAEEVVGRLFASPSLTLAHGRAGLSERYRDLVGRATSSDDATCAPWLADNRRRALLADVGVGTVDQALLAVLPTKFSTLRQWGLSTKLLVVDEVHEPGNP